MAELVDHEVLVDVRPPQQHEVARGVAAKAAEARYAKQPWRDDEPHSAEVDRLGVEAEPVEPGLRPPEEFRAFRGYETEHEHPSEH